MGNYGSFGGPPRALQQSWSAAATWCLQECATCTRCTHVTVSLRYNDCSWYSTCAMNALQKLPCGQLDEFRSGPAPPRKIGRQRTSVGLFPAESHAARNALRSIVAPLRRQPPPWLQPRADLRVALVYFGKVGTMLAPSSFVGSDDGDPVVVSASRASLQSQVRSDEGGASLSQLYGVVSLVYLLNPISIVSYCVAGDLSQPCHAI